MPGNKIHHRRARPDHAARRMDPKFSDNSRFRSLYFFSRQLIGNGLDPLAELKDLTLGLSKRLHNLVLLIVLQFYEHRLGFTDDLVSAGDLGGELAGSSIDLCHLPFQSE